MMQARLSAPEAAVLRLLSRSKPMFGHDIVKKLGPEIPAGTFHILLARMVEKGFVQVDTSPPGLYVISVRLYEMTPKGGMAHLRAVASLAATDSGPKGQNPDDNSRKE